jgi:hypothetical protein
MHLIDVLKEICDNSLKSYDNGHIYIRMVGDYELEIGEIKDELPNVIRFMITGFKESE